MTKHSQNISLKVMQLAVEYINLEKKIKINFSKYSEQKTGYHYNHLCRDFKINVGITISTYINCQKVMIAKEMIKNNPNIKFIEISEKLNFSSRSHFHLVFLNMTGIRPVQYKQQIKNKIGSMIK